MTQLFPTSVCGSMPRPQFVRDLLSQADELPKKNLDETLDTSVKYVVALQESAGLDVLTDGEWRRKSYIGVIADLASGFELSTHPVDNRPLTFVTGTVESTRPGFIAREVSFLKGITDRQIKSTIPAPALLGERLWDAEKSSKAYSNREDFVRACIPILRKEIELIHSAGADIIQIDDPHLCLFVDPKVRTLYENPDRAANFAVDMVNEMIDGIDAKFALHLCRRAGGRARREVFHQGGYDSIIEMLNRLTVNHLTIEFSSPAAGEMKVLQDLRDNFEIGLGCIDVTPGMVDSVEQICDRVHQACQYIDKNRITLNPDCGFAPGSGALVDMDEVYQKLKNENAAAKRLRDYYR